MNIAEHLESGMSRAEVLGMLIATGTHPNRAEFQIGMALGEIDGDRFNVTGSAEPGPAVKSTDPRALIADAYTESLERHLQAVYKSGELLGVPPDQLRQHDASKWSEAEFMPYALNWNGTDEQKAANADAYERAQLHHYHHNPHHWQHWLMVDGDGMRALEMPPAYALEMVADWRGASIAYTGSADMSKWLTEKFGQVILHDSTRALVLAILKDRLGYNCEVSIDWHNKQQYTFSVAGQPGKDSAETDTANS